MENNCSMSLFVRVYALGFRVWGFRVLLNLSRKHDKHTQTCKISDISACKARAGTSRHLPDTRPWQLKFQAKLLLHNSLTSYCKKSQTCTHLRAVRTYVAGVTATGAACAKKRVLRILLEGCAVPSFSKKPTRSRIGIMQMKAKTPMADATLAQIYRGALGRISREISISRSRIAAKQYVPQVNLDSLRHLEEQTSSQSVIKPSGQTNDIL